MARKLTKLGRMMKRCSPKKAPKNVNWKKLGYGGFHECVKRENKKRR